MAPSTVTVEWVGEDGFELWSGNDHGEPVTLNPGEPVDVSTELAKHLSTHFGHLVSIDGAAPVKKRNAVAEAPDPVDQKPTIETLMAQTRDELNALAATHGIDAPDELENKRAVAAAILAVLEDEE